MIDPVRDKVYPRTGRLEMPILVLFLIGMALCGALATGTLLLFQWPGFIFLGGAGVGSFLLWRRRTRGDANGLCLVSAAALAGYLLVRAELSPVDYLARSDTFLLLAGVVVYGMAALVLTGSAERMACFWLLVALGVGNLVLGAVHLSGHPEFSIIPGYFRTYPAGRVGGFFNNPNHLGAALAFVVMLALGQGVFGRGSAVLRLLLFFFAGLAALGAALTVSRGGLLGLAGGLFAFAVVSLPMLRRRFARIPRGLAVAGSGFALALVVGAVIVNVSLMRGRSAGEGIFQETARGKFWKAAVEQFEAEPIWGSGSRSYSYLSRLYRPPDLFTAEGEIEFVHNEYLQLVADYGLVGLGLFLVVVGAHFGNAVRSMWRSIDAEAKGRGASSRARIALCMGSVAGVAGLLVHAVFDFHFHVPAVALPAFFALGVMANPGLGPSEGLRTVKLVWMKRIWKGGLIAVGGVIVCSAVFYGRAEYFLERAERLADAGGGLEDVALLARSRALDPENPQVYLASARAWEGRAVENLPEAARRSFLERAREDYAEACRLHPYDIYSLVAYANCLDALGRRDEARERYLEAMQWAPRFQYCLLSYGMFLHRGGQWAAAADVYRQCYKAHALEDIDGSMARVRELEGILERDRKQGNTKEAE